MKLDLQWRDAMAIWGVGMAFTSVQKKAGWLETMEPQQLAALQRPWDRGDYKARSVCWALSEAITEACAAGQIECVVLSVAPQEHQQDDDLFRHIPMVADRWAIDPSNEWVEREFLGGTLRTQRRMPQRHQSNPAVQTAKLEYRIGADAFTAWLAAQGVEPSVHIAAWFKALGVVPAVAGAGGVQGGDPSSVVLSLVQNPTQPPEGVVAVPGRVPQKSMKPEWTGEKLAQRRQGLNGRDKSKQLSTETGLPEREITRREKAWRDEEMNASKAANGTRH